MTSADAPERQRAREERGDRLLVGGIEHRRRRCRPSRPGRDAEREGAEHVGPHRLEREVTGGHRVEATRARIGQPVGMRERVEDRQLHRGEAHLRHDVAITELREGMHDALRMHDDVHLVV